MDAQTSLFSPASTLTGPAAAESTLRNALARFDEITAACNRAREAMKGASGADFEALHATYETAHARVRDEAFRVVGAAEAALSQLKTR